MAPRVVDDLSTDIAPFIEDERVDLINPEGRLISLPKSMLDDALSTGYRPESDDEKSVRKYVEDNAGVIGISKTAAREFANQLAFGIPEVVADAAQDPLDIEKRKALNAQYPIARFLGGAAGVVGSLGVGGPIFRGATKAGQAVERGLSEIAGERVAQSFLGRTTKAAAKLGTEAAVIGAPLSLAKEVVADFAPKDEKALGDSKTVGETFLYNTAYDAAVGGALGGGLSVVGSILRLGGKLLTAAGFESLSKTAEDAAVKAVGVNTAEHRRLIKERGVKGAEDFSEELGKTLLEQKVVTPFATAASREQKLEALLESAGQEMGAIYQQFDDTGKRFFDVDKVINTIEKYVGRPAKRTTTYWESVKDKYSDFIRDLRNLAPLDAKGERYLKLPSLQEVQNLLNDWKPIIREQSSITTGGVKSSAAVLDEIDGIVRNELNRTVRDFATRTLPPDAALDIFRRYSKAKNTYGQAAVALKGLENTARDKGNQLFSLRDIVTGTGTAVATGDPISGFAVAAGSKILRGTQDQLLATGLYSLNSFVNKTALAIDDAVKHLKTTGFGKAFKDVSGSSFGLSALDRLYDDGDSRLQKFEKFSETLSELENANLRTDVAAKISKPISEFAPEVAASFQESLYRALDYLSQEMPKPKYPQSILNKRKYVPTDRELNTFDRKLKVVVQPLSVFEDIKAGRLSKEAIDTLRNVYPQLYGALQKAVLNAIGESGADYDQVVRTNLGKLLDLKEGIYDQQVVQALQRNYQTQEQRQNPPSRAKFSNPQTNLNRVEFR